jgi:lipoprotein-anchoring transpeptidase ErfK/SrfK
MRRHFSAALLAISAMLFRPETAMAERLIARVNVSEQMMRVYHEGRLLFAWPVSTAKPGKITPAGIFTPETLSKNHRSRLYNNAPMPYAIFYDGNYAIHGTDQISRLGKPASHGCVRLHPDNARILFGMVRAEGMENTRVVIVQ